MYSAGSAPKRRACVRCATAKAKCSFTESERGCDRCRRLSRECIPEEAPRRMKVKQSHRVKALEEKVDTLLSLLGPEKAGLARDATASILDSRRTPAPTEETCSPACGSTKSATAQSTADTIRFDPINHGLLTMATAESLLSKYKNVYSRYFPFVIVAREVDAATLRATSPFLFLSIMTTCIEGDHLLQRRLAAEFKRIMCERIVLGNERSLELLQGLLVQLGWSHFHFTPGTKRLNMLLQVAVSVVLDLDLDRCPAHLDQRVSSHLYCTSYKGDVLGITNLQAQCRRPPAEIRALLGCYYISSSLAAMRRELAMTHTKWIDTCCRILQVEQDVPTDKTAIALIKARTLVHKAGERFSYDEPFAIRSQSDVLIQMSLNGLKKEIAQLESDPAFSPIHKNYVLTAELKVLPIVIHEVVLYRDLATSSPSEHGSQLWALLNAARDFLTYALDIPNETMVQLPASFFNLLPYAMIALSAVVRMPSTSGWDSAIARRESDATNFLGRVKTKFADELTKTSPDTPPEQRDVWQFFSRGLGGLMAWHQKCETSGGPDGDMNIPISSPSAIMRCGVADTMHAFSSMTARGTFANVAREPVNPTLQSTSLASRPDAQPDAGMGSWDDEAWQAIMDDFSMFPTTAGLPVGSITQY